ncbi:MAG: iron chelate uptake ABC transporter family permease subunit, partial [Oscillospiraceae bacterium]|nr:iron chelate uptake ABC transporter family permease subunit [Oscillospiraceae bacterium]
LLAALMAGAAVSFAGLLGFVGLLIPHLCRRLIVTESRFLLPLSALMGAGFVTLCDVLARVLFAPYELYVGILLSLIGGPVFLFLLLRKRGGHRNA